MFAIWCEAADRHRKACQGQAKLERESGGGALLTKTATGAVVQSPWISIIERSAALMLKTAEQLGFTPQARPFAPIDLPLPEHRADLATLSTGRDLIPF